MAIAEACADAAFDGAGLRRALIALMNGNARDQERARYLSDWLTEPASRAANFANYRKAFFTNQGTGKLFERLISTSARRAAPAGRRPGGK